MPSTGNYDSDYVANSAAANDAKIKAINDHFDKRRAAREAAATEPATSDVGLPKRETPAAAGDSPGESTDSPAPQPGILGSPGDYPGAVMNGLLDLGRETLKTFTPEGLESVLDAGLATPPKSEDAIVPGVVRGVTQFGAGTAAIAAGLLYAAPAAATALGAAALPSAAAVGSAVTSAVGFDPMEDRLADLAIRFGGIGDNTFTRWLDATEDDSEGMARFKAATEDVTLTLGTLGLAKAFGPAVKRMASHIMAKKGVEGTAVESVVGEALHFTQLSEETGARVVGSVNGVKAAREAADAILNVEQLVKDAQKTESDHIIEAMHAGTSTPEQASRIEAGQFRAGASGESIQDAIRGQGGGERSALAELAETNPTLAARYAELTADGGSLVQARERVMRDLEVAERQYAETVMSLHPDLADKVSLTVDTFVPERVRGVAEETSKVVREHLGRAREGIPALPEPPPSVASAALPGRNLPQAAEEALQLAARQRGPWLNQVGEAINPSELVDFGRPGSTLETADLLGAHLHRAGDGVTGVAEDTLDFLRIGPEALQRHALEQGTHGLGVVAATAEKYKGHAGRAAANIARLTPEGQPVDYVKRVVGLTALQDGAVNRASTLARRISSELGASSADMAEFLRLRTLDSNIAGVLAGSRNADLDRSFDLFRFEGKTPKGRRLTQLKESQRQADKLSIEEFGGSDKVKKMATLWANGVDALSAKDRLSFHRTTGGRWSNAAYEAFVNLLLSSPVTITRNVLNNLYMMGFAPSVHALGSVARGNLSATADITRAYRGMLKGVDASFNLLATLGQGKEAFGHLISGDLAAAGRAAVEAAEAAGQGTVGQAARTGEPITAGYKGRQYELATKGRAISSGALGWQNKVAARLVDAVGTAINLPSRALVTGDELSKTIAYHMGLEDLLFDAGNGKGLQGAAFENFSQEVRDYVKLWHTLEDHEVTALSRTLGVTEDSVVPFLKNMDEAAQTNSRRMTFSDELIAGTFTQKVQQSIRTTPGLRWMAPFIKVPANIINLAYEHSALAPVWKNSAVGQRTRLALARGGREAEAAKNRMLVGQGIWLMAGYMASTGQITGTGPVNSFEAKNLRETGGVQPNSVRLTDADGNVVQFGFDTFQPVAKMLTTMADLTDIISNMDESQQQKIVPNLLMGLADALMESGPFSSVVKTIAGIAHPDREGLKAIESILVPLATPGAKVVKTLRGSRALPLAKANPELEGFRQYADYIGQLAANAYGVDTADKPWAASYNLLGEIRNRPHGYGNDTLSPVWRADEPDDVVSQEFRKLSEEGQGIRLTNEEVYGTLGTQPPIRLSLEQQYEIMKIATGERFFNSNLRDALAHLMNSPRYKRASSGGRVVEGVAIGSGGKSAMIQGLIAQRAGRAKDIFEMRNRDVREKKRLIENAAKLDKKGVPQEQLDKILKLRR